MADDDKAAAFWAEKLDDIPQELLTFWHPGSAAQEHFFASQDKRLLASYEGRDVWRSQAVCQLPPALVVAFIRDRLAADIAEGLPEFKELGVLWDDELIWKNWLRFGQHRPGQDKRQGGRDGMDPL